MSAIKLTPQNFKAVHQNTMVPDLHIQESLKLKYANFWDGRQIFSSSDQVQYNFERGAGTFMAVKFYSCAECEVFIDMYLLLRRFHFYGSYD